MRRSLLVLSLLLLPLPGATAPPQNSGNPGTICFPWWRSTIGSPTWRGIRTTAYLLDPADASFKPQVVTVGKAPIAAVKHNGGKPDAGLEQRRRRIDQRRGHPGTVFRSSTPIRIAPIIRSLAGRFDGLTQSADGRFVVLYHTSSTAGRRATPACSIPTR